MVLLLLLLLLWSSSSSLCVVTIAGGTTAGLVHLGAAGSITTGRPATVAMGQALATAAESLEAADVDACCFSDDEGDEHEDEADTLLGPANEEPSTLVGMLLHPSVASEFATLLSSPAEEEQENEEEAENTDVEDVDDVGDDLWLLMLLFWLTQLSLRCFVSFLSSL